MRIGARVRNADLAYDPTFSERFPAVAKALLSGASAQLRNAATVGGNLLQRTRCAYFCRSADLDDAVGPSAAGKFDNFLVPVRRLDIIDHGRRPVPLTVS